MDLSKTKAKKMLEAIYKLSLNASMAGQFTDGCFLLMTNYNKIRTVAIQNGWVDEDWVVELIRGENVNKDVEWVDVIGTATKLFLTQLEDEYDDNGFKIKEDDEE